MRPVRFTPGFRLEQPLQLAFSNVDRSSASDERVEDLLSAASSHLGVDNVRALYFANEAYSIANADEHVENQLDSLLLIIDALKRSGRVADGTPFIARAIELSQSIHDRRTLDALVDLLGRWAIEMEREPTARSSGRRGATPPMGWLVSAISRLERERNRITTDAPVEQVPAAPTDDRRTHLGIDDLETGLLNGRGMAAELLQIDQQTNTFALIQITVVPDDFPVTQIATIAASTTGEDGVLARNARSQITIILPRYTGIEAMTLAENLKTNLIAVERETDVTIGIGVAIKQPHENARDVLRRVTDRAEEAAWQSGISVVG